MQQLDPDARAISINAAVQLSAIGVAVSYAIVMQLSYHAMCCNADPRHWSRVHP